MHHLNKEDEDEVSAVMKAALLEAGGDEQDACNLLNLRSVTVLQCDHACDESEPSDDAVRRYNLLTMAAVRIHRSMTARARQATIK